MLQVPRMAACPTPWSAPANNPSVGTRPEPGPSWRPLGAPRRRHDGVGVRAVGDDRGVAYEADPRAVQVDGGFAGTDVAAIGALGRRRGEQPLIVRDSTLKDELPGITAGMADEAGDLDLMHRKNHSGRAASAAQDRADVRDVRRTRAFAAEP